MSNLQNCEEVQDDWERGAESENDKHHNNDQRKQTVQGVGIFFCMIYLIGTKIGAGIIGLHYAVFKIGFTTSLIFKVAYVIIGIFTFYLLFKVREITGKSTISEIGYFCYCRPSIFFINVLIDIAQLGFPVIFFIVYGDVAGGLIKKINHSNINFWESRWFTHILLAILMIYFVIR